MVKVPNVEGKSVQDATSILQNAGLVVNAQQGLEAPSADKNGLVYDQKPSGYTVQEGTSVTITYYANAKEVENPQPQPDAQTPSPNPDTEKPVEPSTPEKPDSNDVIVPDVVGMTVDEAMSKLQSVGLVPYKVGNPDGSAKVTSQTWVPGRPAPKGSPINISA